MGLRMIRRFTPLMIMAIGLSLSAMAGSTNTTPYAEGFEQYWSGFSLAGTNGWEAGAGSSAVITNTEMHGTFKYFYALETNHEYCLGINGWVTNRVASPSNAHVWVDMLMPPMNQRVYVGGADGTEYFSFWPSGAGVAVHHTYYRSGRYTNDSQTTNFTVVTGEWVRVSIDQDYGSTSTKGYNSFRILVNGKALMGSANQYTNNMELNNTKNGGEWFAMLVTNTHAMGMIWISATNGTGCLDDLVVKTNTPDFSAMARGQVSISGVDTNAEVMGVQARGLPCEPR